MSIIDEHVKAVDAIRIAIKREKETLDYYTKAESVVNDAGAKKMFEHLIHHSKEHIRLLEEEYDLNIMSEM
ncbi:MAG: hypothetical protein HZA77_10110 [Candidatus Schekmanbacteria bacterium]|nr:hypothetical protein [Candidatus Schekmanbacteria bacterium]